MVSQCRYLDRYRWLIYKCPPSIDLAMNDEKSNRDRFKKCAEKECLEDKVDCLINGTAKGFDGVEKRFNGVDKQLEAHGKLLIELKEMMERIEGRLNVMPTIEQFKEQGDRVQAGLRANRNEMEAMRTEMAATRASVLSELNEVGSRINAKMDDYFKKMGAKMDGDLKKMGAKLDMVLVALKER